MQGSESGEGESLEELEKKLREKALMSMKMKVGAVMEGKDV